ncbi:serine hydrolase domain-containing protein [Aliikangiella coralliicola]|uniref:Beta-lactamase family protein n=1 Tax=Aliikangiella coralliicola TaxID=2592383 RepID=A0A545UFR7_9GAMM|nr:serine hydrolase domain-containing protein [Aliikangiella coralliicola]TQV88318.1 beta-lactamase family protein [Aliikangiella coralliicola]
MLRKSCQSLSILIVLIALSSCAFFRAEVVDIEPVSKSRALELDSAFERLLDKHKINTIGVAVIKNGAVDWQGYFGEQSPGVKASADTLFNVASITKTVTSETILRLASAGKISLDEPMSLYWVDPDLKYDPDLKKLTPRMALTHTSGFMNWRFFANDYKLKFVSEPGTKFGYSGEGFQYVAKYAENKLGVPFEALVKSTVFEPMGINDVSISVRKKNYARIAKPLDKDGKFYGYYCHPEGYCRKEAEYSAAGDMVITVADYAKFFIASMQGNKLTEQLKNERNTLQSIQVDRKDIDCSGAPDALCPIQLGYGLGWSVAQLENDRLIGHRGSDWSTVSLAYCYQNSGDGLIIFFNAPNKAGIAAMVEALELLDPDSPEIHGYKMRRARTD